MNLSKKPNKLIESTGLYLLGVFSLAYVLYKRLFAELYIQLPFLDFPVFVGEILLGTCLILCLIKYSQNPSRFGKWHWVVLLYFVFVITKALYGYTQHGPLALRHSALFYYLAFALVTYGLYDEGFFRHQTRARVIVLTIIGIFVFNKYNIYWTFTCFALACILIKNEPNRIAKTVLFLTLLIVTPYYHLVYTSRMMILSNFVSELFLALAFYLIWNQKRSIKIGIVVIALALIGFLMYQSGDHNSIRSLVKLKALKAKYASYNEKIEARMDGFVMEERPQVKLFNSDWENSEKQKIKYLHKIQVSRRVERSNVPAGETIFNQDDDIELAEQTDRPFFVEDSTSDKYVWVSTKEDVIPDLNRKSQEDLVDASGKKYRNLDSATGNSVFRLLIWRDMFRELFKEKPWLGFNFGKPLRSISLEVLNWGKREWTRDGWVAPHNSYIHMIYRAGFVGVAVIIFVVWLLLRMIVFFIRQKSITGILLSSIVINWFVAANFLVIFELPYTAVMIWTLYGLTFAHYMNLRKQQLAHSHRT